MGLTDGLEFPDRLFSSLQRRANVLYSRYGTRNFAEITGAGWETRTDLPICRENTPLFSLDADNDARDVFSPAPWTHFCYSIFSELSVRGLQSVIS